jgi:hypothetical protein
MRRGFTTPRHTARGHTIAQVKGAVEGWVVERREAARSTVSGKFLAHQSSFDIRAGTRGRRQSGTGGPIGPIDPWLTKRMISPSAARERWSSK